MKISSPIVISSDDDPTPRKRAWDEWGAGADLVYVPSDDEEPAHASDAERAISVTSGSESAISVTSGSEEDPWDSWGADAVLHFSNDSDFEAYEAPSPPREPSPTPARAPRAAQAPAAPQPPRPEMPDYDSWEIPKLKVSSLERSLADLQKLVEGYGFRAGKDKGGLVRVATECWVAIHGAAAPSESEEDVPLAQLHTPKATKRRAAKGAAATASSRSGPAVPATPSKTKDKGKGKQDMTEEQLDELFFTMIRDDDPFYLRILRYEPIHWDEFVSRALRAGAHAKGWKDRMRMFLDKQGITFYTADPSQPRSRQKKRK